jgi:dienelactone hydrolase
VDGAEWLKIEGAGGNANNMQTAAVLRPAGPGPFPLVIHLHGGVGLHVIDVSKAARLTSAGFVVLVGCWEFTSADPEVYDGVSFPTVPCLMNNADARAAVRALIDVGHQLPGITPTAIGLSGGSAGGPIALDAVGTNNDIKAVVVDSSPCGPPKVNAPVLMLGGTADPTVSIEAQRSCEQTLRDHGSTVESHFYEGGGHAVTYFGEFQDDAVRRMIEFFKRYLTPG